MGSALHAAPLARRRRVFVSERCSRNRRRAERRTGQSCADTVAHPHQRTNACLHSDPHHEARGPQVPEAAGDPLEGPRCEPTHERWPRDGGQKEDVGIEVHAHLRSTGGCKRKRVQNTLIERGRSAARAGAVTLDPLNWRSWRLHKRGAGGRTVSSARLAPARNRIACTSDQPHPCIQAGKGLRRYT